MSQATSTPVSGVADAGVPAKQTFERALALSSEHARAEETDSGVEDAGSPLTYHSKAG